MEYENLWPDPIENQHASTANISTIMKQQATYLKEMTQGKAFLRFAHIKKVEPFSMAVSAMTSISAITKLQASDEYIGNSSINELKDANELYSQKRFGCEIYNRSYRFRLFEMDLPPLYPIDICVDEGIASDISKQYPEEAYDQGTLQVNNDDEFIKLLRFIFSSKKVSYILTRLMETNQ